MFNVREACRDDIPTLIDFQLRLAKETESLDLDLAALTKGVHAPFEQNQEKKPLPSAPHNLTEVKHRLCEAHSEWTSSSPHDRISRNTVRPHHCYITRTATSTRRR